MPDIPKDASFVKDLDYAHVVVLVFKNEENRPEISVWGYRSKDDAQKRFERIIDMHKKEVNASGESHLVMTQTFMVGLYENFEQSLFAEGRPSDKVN